ncbi:11176_t:CDS:2, partial [Dentiscutata heterogama]
NFEPFYMELDNSSNALGKDSVSLELQIYDDNDSGNSSILGKDLVFLELDNDDDLGKFHIYFFFKKKKKLIFFFLDKNSELSYMKSDNCGSTLDRALVSLQWQINNHDNKNLEPSH